MNLDESAEPFQWYILSIFKPLTFETSLEFTAMLILLLCSALISGSEVAFFSLSPQELKEVENDQNDKRNTTILSLLKAPKRLLATILIANNFVNVAIIILSTLIIDNVFNFTAYPILGFVIQVVVVTFLILLMGEVIPKVYANKNSIQLLHLMSYPISVMSKLFYPLSMLLLSFTRIIDKRVSPKSEAISVDELSHALELTKDETVGEEDHKILKEIVKFGNTSVKQIMTSRVDVVAIDYQQNCEEIIQLILDSGYSRLPVFEENFDTIKGILYIKDLLPHLEKGPDFEWRNLIRQAFFVPENKKIDDLLKEFQEKKIHLAIVVDEYGGSSGVISLEDVIEEIVGEISDEFDDEDLVYSKLDDRNYVFQGKILLNDFYKVLEIEGDEFEEEKGESDTLAGFILEINGKIPAKNESISFKNYEFIIEVADSRKISMVKVVIHEKTEEELADEED